MDQRNKEEYPSLGIEVVGKARVRPEERVEQVEHEREKDEQEQSVQESHEGLDERENEKEDRKDEDPDPLLLVDHTGNKVYSIPQSEGKTWTVSFFHRF